MEPEGPLPCSQDLDSGTQNEALQTHMSYCL